MNLKNWVKVIKESIKDTELNRILDKLSSGEILSIKERYFLDKFDDIKEEDLMDQSYLSMLNTYFRIKDLLNKGKRIICGLVDGMGTQIQFIENHEDKCLIELNNGETCYLKDSLLYNIIYNLDRDEYYLQSQDEFYEKILLRNNED
jgi:hypothetical protein